MRLLFSATAPSDMTKKERASIIYQTLMQHYPQPDIPLHHSDPFTLLVAVALSAQCTDARVNLVTPALFQIAGNARAMSALEATELLPYIATCGLAKGKSERLVTMARQLMERHRGEVPDTFEALEALAGVGHKTASVVMNQAFGHPAFPVDTHIYRLAKRWKLSRGSNVKKVEIDLKKAFLKEQWGDMHLRIVLWGREHCPARGCKPTCKICEQMTAPPVTTALQ